MFWLDMTLRWWTAPWPVNMIEHDAKPALSDAGPGRASVAGSRHFPDGLTGLFHEQILAGHDPEAASALVASESMA